MAGGPSLIVSAPPTQRPRLPGPLTPPPPLLYLACERGIAYLRLIRQAHLLSNQHLWQGWGGGFGVGVGVRG